MEPSFGVAAWIAAPQEPLVDQEMTQPSPVCAQSTVPVTNSSPTPAEHGAGPGMMLATLDAVLTTLFLAHAWA
jgi:hypothetical protein